MPSTNEGRPSLADLTQLPPTIDIATAGKIIGVSRSMAFELALRGDIPSIQLGRRRVVPTQALIQMLNDAGAASMDGADK